MNSDLKPYLNTAMREFDINKLPKIEPYSQEAINALTSSEEISIEIGCGVGMHPILWGNSHLSGQLIAIERTKDKFRKFNNTISNYKELMNRIHPVHADAVLWISQFVKPQSIAHYYTLYPNPYPKKKQSNLRFHNMPFTEHMIDTLVPGGKITLATNIKNYAEEACEIYQKVWGLSLLSSETLDQNFPARTHFEKKYLARGQSCFNLVFQKEN